MNKHYLQLPFGVSTTIIAKLTKGLSAADDVLLKYVTLSTVIVLMFKHLVNIHTIKSVRAISARLSFSYFEKSLV